MWDAAAKCFRVEASSDAKADAVDAARSLMTPLRSSLFDAVPRRSCPRATYDGKPFSTADCVRVMILTETKCMERILEYIPHGNSSQTADRDFTAELKT